MNHKFIIGSSPFAFTVHIICENCNYIFNKNDVYQKPEKIINDIGENIIILNPATCEEYKAQCIMESVLKNV